MSHGVELPEIPRIFRDGVKRIRPGNRGLIPLLGIQVLVLTPGVRVQVPPRAPCCGSEKDIHTKNPETSRLNSRKEL